MDFNQVYKAPSVPKLSKRNISSSVIRGASVTTAKPKLKTTKFSFANQQQNLVLSSGAEISQTLAETNNILVEIQKQLSIDFASRIAEEKETIKRIKAEETKRKFFEKEKALESSKKIGGGVVKTFDKVIAPAKGIFDKIKEFFSLILTGIVLSVVGKWLQDPNNRKKVESVFQFVGTYWKEIIATFIGIKVFGFVYKLIKLGRLVSRLFRRGGPTPSGPPPRPPSKPPVIKPSASPLTQAKGSGPLARPKPPKPILGPSGQPLGGGPLSQYKGADSAPARAPGIPKPGTGVKPAKPVVPKGRIPFPGWLGRLLRVVGLALLIAELKEDWAKGDYKAVAVKLTAYGLGWAVTALTATVGTALGIGTAPTGVGAAAGLGLAASSMALGYGTDVGIRKLFGYKDGGTIRASNGMTVPGSGPGTVDSVRALLAPGEEVIRAAAARLFRPVLKDINDNGGRMWNAFTQGIGIMLTVISKMRENSEKLGEEIEKFGNYIKKEVESKNLQKAKNAGNLGGYRGGSSKMSSIPKKYNYSLISQGDIIGEGSPIIMPMNLPAITSSNVPQMPTPQRKANEVDYIPSVNSMNRYMKITPELYGIVG